MTIPQNKRVGIAGTGAIGSVVARALVNGINGLTLDCISDPAAKETFGVDNVNFQTLVQRVDLIIECLPAHIVPSLAKIAFSANKDILFISAAALLVYPELLDAHKSSTSRIYVPSGALAGIDGVKAMKQMGITSSKIASTKKPSGFSGAPYVIEKNINLDDIKEKTMIFSGNALEASRGFPANINVAATLSLAGIGAELTRVEIWADPDAKGNSHEISVNSAYSSLTCRIENMPDPNNPKSSVLAAQSIITALLDLHNYFAVS